jgi:hypothetical protein
LGKPGTDQPGGVHKYALPRSDLKITVDGVAIMPTLALGRRCNVHGGLSPH